MSHFADRLFAAVEEKKSAVVVGLDPDLALIPPELFPPERPGASVRQRASAGVVRFLKQIITATADIAVAVKPQLAYFERLGPPGLEAYETVVQCARDQDLLVITDGKRNDVAQTARQYSAAYLGAAGFKEEASDGNGSSQFVAAVDEAGPKADALTVNGYMGRDSLEPFVDETRTGRGLFVLVKTSNPSSGDLQDLTVVAVDSARGEDSERRVVAEHVGHWIERWNVSMTGVSGYGPIGAVIGATYPAQLAALRAALPKTPFLIPGFGFQGGSSEDVALGFDGRGFGAVVNASRSILYAYRRERQVSFDQASRRAAQTMRDALWNAIRKR